MINLLSPDVKTEIAYARRNNELLNYCLIMIALISGMAIITTIGLFYMRSSKIAYQKQVEQTKQSLQSQQLEAVQKQAEEISGNIKLTTDVLSRQLLYSKLIRQIGAAIPDKTSLSDLKITKGENGISLTAVAADYDSATQVQVNLADQSNKIFKKADIVRINCEKLAQKCPCTVEVRALFGDNSSYLFINPKKDKS